MQRPALDDFDLRLEPGSGRPRRPERRGEDDRREPPAPLPRSRGGTRHARRTRSPRATARRTSGARSRSPARTRTSSTRRSARTSGSRRPDATDAGARDALRRARLDEWVASLPDGLDTLVGEEGAQLSGASASASSLARALLADAPVLRPRRADRAPRRDDGRSARRRRPRRGGRTLGPPHHASSGGTRPRRRGRAPRRRCERPGPGVGSYAVAEILALVAAFCFALAATLQQKGALGMGEVSLGSAEVATCSSSKQKWWLARARSRSSAGYVFQAVALDNGQLAVVQPLLVTTIVFALPLGYFLTNQADQPHARSAAPRSSCLGLAAFTIFGNAGTAATTTPRPRWATAVLGSFGARRRRSSSSAEAGVALRKAALLRRVRRSPLWRSRPRCGSRRSRRPQRRRPRGRCSTSLGGSTPSPSRASIAFGVQQISLATGQLGVVGRDGLGLQPARQHRHRHRRCSTSGSRRRRGTRSLPTPGLRVALYAAVLITAGDRGPEGADGETDSGTAVPASVPT